jgi:hypothetical protein
MPKLMFVLFLFFVCDLPALAQLGIPKPSTEQVIVRPKEIDDVLNNPGIGFSTFQRFNGDALNAGTGWTEGHPIEYQEFDGDLTNPDYPATTTAYFRVYWRYVEPEPERYNWPMLDKALKTAAERGQTLCLRIATYAEGENEDVPDWYRKLVGPEPKLASDKWRTDPENPNYVRYFGGMIRALGERYDGHPDLEWVDVSIVGFWGEGDGSHLLSDPTRLALLNSYLDSFKKTHLIFQPLNGDAPDTGPAGTGHTDRRILARREQQRRRPGHSSPRLARRLHRRHGILARRAGRLVPYVRSLSSGHSPRRYVRGLEKSPDCPRDLRHVRELAAETGLRCRGGEVHLRSGAEVACQHLQRQEQRRPG